MASLQQEPTGVYHVVVRINGQRYKRSLRTKSKSKAITKRAEIEENIELIRRKKITVPAWTTTIDFVLNDCKQTKTEPTDQTLPTPPLRLKQSRNACVQLKVVFEKFFDAIPHGNIEFDTLRMIADAVRDVRGNLIQVIDGRNTITMNQFDALGRQKQTTRGHGTAMALTSSTTYTPRGQVELTTDPAGMQVKTEYDDAGNVEKRTQAFGTPHALETSYTYDPKGRQKTVTSPGGGISTSHYDDCCGNSAASEDAYGDGSVRVADAGGRTVYQAQVKDFDFVNGNYKDPPAAETLHETTTRYHENGRVKYTTRWKSARGSIDPANPPIAGVDGVPISEGVTTQYVYYYNLHSSGYFTQSITRLDGTSATINMYNVMNKILAPIASGGIGLNFNGGHDTSSHAKATLVISPDEKTMQCSVTDGMGRTVFSGLVHGPASTNFNDLINWNCTLYDQGHTLSGFGDTSKVTQVDRDGNTTSSLSDGFGQSWLAGSR